MLVLFVVLAEHIVAKDDIGSKLGVLKACVELGLSHSEVGNSFKEYLKKLVSAW